VEWDVDVCDEIVLHLRARVPLLVFVTGEEERALGLLDRARAARDPAAEMFVWDAAGGLRGQDGRRIGELRTVEAAIERITELVARDPQRRDLYVLCDVQAYWDKSPAVRRRLRSLARAATSTRSSVVVLVPTSEIPADLADEVAIVTLPLPDTDVLGQLLDELVEGIPGLDCRLDRSGRDGLVRGALGLTAAQAARAFARAIVTHGLLDERCISAVLEEKRRAVQATPGLDFIDARDDGEHVGGLEHLKAWLRVRAPTQLERAAAYGLPAPKGIALIGIPGTGKSLAARMVARTWRVPLLRLDMAGIYHSRLGQTEQCLSRALAIAEAVSPSVLWVDEVEKLLAHGDQDGGTSLRVLAAMLTWMQERTAPVFVVATANDVAALPPELLRRGRFDEVFFLDLPSEAERAAIIGAQLGRRGRDPRAFDVDLLARLSVGLVGAELEQSLTEAMFHAFSDDREVCTQDIADAVLATVPLSRSAQERVAAQRAWMREGRARPASGPDPDSTWDADLRLP
jgi:hypothetical protein